MANQATKSSKVPLQRSKGPRVKPDSSVIARAAGLLLACVILATTATMAIYHYQDFIFRSAGGEIREASAQATTREVLKEVYPDKSQEERDSLRAFKQGKTLYIPHTTTAYWLAQTFHNGWVQYAILHGFLTGFLYMLGVGLWQLIPGWHLSSAPRRFRSIAEQMVELRRTGVDDIGQIIEKIDGNDRFADRLHKLQQHYSREPNRQLCREANEAYSQSEQAEALYVTLPLGFIEFVLPIFGFIGTVLGVIDAVAALRSGMEQLFQAGELTREVVSQFMLGFDGLVLAFMTTLFGLLGLALTALFRFHLRRNAMAVIAKIDEWSEEAINLLPQEDLLKLIAEALIVHDEKGQAVRDKDNRVVPRWLEVLGETTADGQPVCDEEGQPLSRLRKLEESLREALFEPAKDGAKPIPALQGVYRALRAVDKSLREALFEPAKEGDKPIPALQGVGRMIQVVTDAVRHIHNALMHHIFQIVGDDDRNQSTPLIVYTTDEETGETHSMEVQGRYRFERQHAETVAWMSMLTEEIIKNMPPAQEDEGGEPPISPGRLVIPPAEEPVRQIAASAAAFAVVRGTDHTTGESELVSGCYEAVTGQMVPCEADRKRLPMAITGLGFSARKGVEATRFAVYMPFAPIDPWQQHGARQLLPPKCLVRYGSAFHSDHEVLSTHLAFLQVRERTWLLFLAKETGEDKAGKTGLFALPVENDKDTPQRIGDFLEGQLVGEAVFPGETYAFALRNGGSTDVVVVSPGETKPQMQCRKSRTQIAALAFDSAGVLHYASPECEIGTVPLDGKGLQCDRRLDHAGQSAFLACSSTNTLYVALCGDSAELLLVRTDNNGGKQPEFKSVVYPRLITTLTASSDGRFIFVGCADGSVFVRNG